MIENCRPVFTQLQCLNVSALSDLAVKYPKVCDVWNYLVIGIAVANCVELPGRRSVTNIDIHSRCVERRLLHYAIKKYLLLVVTFFALSCANCNVSVLFIMHSFATALAVTLKMRNEQIFESDRAILLSPNVSSKKSLKLLKLVHFS